MLNSKKLNKMTNDHKKVSFDIFKINLLITYICINFTNITNYTLLSFTICVIVKKRAPIGDSKITIYYKT